MTLGIKQDNMDNYTMYQAKKKEWPGDEANNDMKKKRRSKE